MEKKKEESGIIIEERMGHMEDNIERIVKLLQNIEEKIPKGDVVGQGTHDDKNSAHIEKPSVNKHTFRRSDYGWSPRGIQFPKIDMRKFHEKDPITWIFQMEKLFDIHQVPNLQKVTAASLYLEPQ